MLRGSIIKGRPCHRISARGLKFICKEEGGEMKMMITTMHTPSVESGGLQHHRESHGVAKPGTIATVTTPISPPFFFPLNFVKAL
jgi:hypothetical protein